MHPRLHNFNVRIPERGCLGTKLGARPSKIRGSGSETIHAVGNLAHFLEPGGGGRGSGQRYNQYGRTVLSMV